MSFMMTPPYSASSAADRASAGATWAGRYSTSVCARDVGAGVERAHALDVHAVGDLVRWPDTFTGC
jgi:hypothetical protein